jgi:hypothetical protein
MIQGPFVRTFVVVTVVWLLVPAPAVVGQTDAAAYYRDSEALEALIAAGEMRSAYELVQTLNARNPDDSLQWWTQGRLAARLELWDAAADEAHARAGRKGAALDWLERSLELGLDQRFELIDNPAFAAYMDDARFVRITGLAPQDMADRAARWRFDIDFLTAEARRLHADPRRPAEGARFSSAAEALKDQVVALTDTEMMMGVQRLVVLLGDGHSYVSVGDLHDKGRQPADVDDRTLPVFFHPFGDDVYIIDGQQEGAALIGGRVVSFGDVPILDFIDRVDPYLHKDNPESWKFIGAQFAFRKLALHEVVGTASGLGVPVMVEFTDGRRELRVLPGGDYDFPRKLRPMPGQAAVPMFLENVDTVYWGRSLPAHQAHYVQINNFRDAEEGETLEEFATRVVDEALAGNADNLIVDLRLNNGGSNFLCDGLLRDLLRFQFAGADHRILVITRHETFSAAQNCSTRIEAVTDAVFVGEPSASRPNFTGEETQTVLPYSGLIVSISNRYWQDSQPWDNRPWIPMDIPAPLTFEAYAAGRDPALETIFTVINADEGGIP